MLADNHVQQLIENEHILKYFQPTGVLAIIALATY